MHVLQRRAAQLERLADQLVDVLVVGGGATGAGVALDAASRGYSVTLVEQDDLASGTSSKSSKLIHGGIRYLANADIAMVVEGVRERNRLRRLAPHLVRPLGFVIPVDTTADVALLRAGLTLYDAIGIGRGARPHRRLSRDEVLLDAPGLQGVGSRGGFRYDDAQTDDARLVLQVARCAHDEGASILTHTRVLGIEHDDGVRVVRLRDQLTGGEFRATARWVIDAAGAWADRIGDVGPDRLGVEIRPAKGAHLVFDRSDFPVRRAIVLPSVTGDGRRVFLIPWGDQVYLGTTDDLETDVESGPTVGAADASYLLDAANAAFGSTLTVEDAIGAWAGWRPLVASKGDTKDLSRRHMIAEPEPGLVVVTGGKLTTYRRMARDTVDHLVRGDGIRRRSRTHRMPLGAALPASQVLAATRDALVRLGADPGLAPSVHLRHGDAAPDVIAGFGPEEAGRLLPSLPYVVGEVAHAVQHEWALTLDDMLSRRMRVSLRHRQAGGEAIERVAQIMAGELGWSDAVRQEQVSSYLAGVRAERGVVPL